MMRILVLMTALLLAGCSAAPEAPPAPAAPAGPLPETSIYNLPGSWQDQNGQEVTLEQLRGKVQLMALIYASCKGACPRIIADMKLLEGLVPAEVEFVLVSIDPEVDTPERLRQLAAETELDERWRLLRGTPDQVLELAALLGVKYRKVSDTDYAHSNIITVLDEDGVVLHQQEGLGVDPAQSVKAASDALSSEPACCEE